MTSPWKDYPVDADAHAEDEPYTRNIADQIIGGILILVVILALIGGATVIKEVLP